MNVDWFQPFEHTQHSEGVVYLSIFNLPHKERFLQHNILLVGIIPGPKKPELHINLFLQPLVDELKMLCKGVEMLTSTYGHTIVRAALLCVGCDILAARNVSGILGHRATLGCSRCLMSFPTVHFGDKPDYSNFDRRFWKIRDGNSHKAAVKKHKECITQASQSAIEKEDGVRYSCLLQLPYFDSPHMCIIDPTHNLFLGTAKHTIEVWKSTGIITTKHFEEIQEKVNSFNCPNDIGRIPSKIQFSFSGFPADQWKN